MDTAQLLELLKDVFFRRIFAYGIMAAIALLVIACVLFFPAKAAGDNKNRHRKKLGFALILLSILPVVAVPELTAIHNDISGEQLICAYGSYTFQADATSRRGTDDWATVEIDAETPQLKLPPNWKQLDFPQGTFWGELCYSEESGILLRIIPDIQAREE